MPPAKRRIEAADLMKDYYLKGEERFGRITAPLYDLLTNIPSVRRLYDFIVEDLESSGAEEVLDIGTGPGTVPIRLARSGKFRKVYGVDPSKEMIYMARKRSAELENIEFSLGSSRYIPFEKKFDIIFASVSFHHWNARSHALRFLSYYLKRGGEIRIYEFNAEKTPPLLRVFVPTHAVWKADIYKVAKESGLKIREIMESGPFIRAVFIRE